MNECNSACILQHTATHCNTLPTALVSLIPISVDVYTCLYTYVWKSANVRVNLPTAHATHCNILQHTVNHALQLTATHCNSHGNTHGNTQGNTPGNTHGNTHCNTN